MLGVWAMSRINRLLYVFGKYKRYAQLYTCCEILEENHVPTITTMHQQTEQRMTMADER